jgi:hypothetical protein
VVLVARPWWENGRLVDLPGQIVGAGRRAGLAFVERNVALLCALRGGGIVARPSFFQLDRVRKARSAGKPVALIAHEDVLVLELSR